jgi:anthranilate phosphoribosyltransferase
MAIKHFIKEIGRGAAGARSLTRAQAQELMGAVLAGETTPLELGAMVMALRMKGESLDELCGFLDAVHGHCLPLHSDQPVVVIPSYNGARRLPNLTPLLALLLAQQGVRVLVHGALHEPPHEPPQTPARVTTAEIFHDLGLQPAHNSDDLHGLWARHEPAFMSTATLCPPLQALLDVRWTVGLRNSGHMVAKMIQPFTQGSNARCLRLVNYTHPEFGALMKAWGQQEKADTMLLRGTEGEPVADPRRQPRIDSYVAGLPCAAGSSAAFEGVVTQLPLLPSAIDAATTALYIQAVLAGERPAPAPVARQVQLVRAALAAMGGAAGHTAALELSA